jgi:hypothetical protein
MGGSGSGNRWHFGAASTTVDYRALDVRYLARNSMLRSGYSGSLLWKRNGETVASIRVRADAGRIVLIYRHRSDGGGAWKGEEYSVRIARTPCNLGGSRDWFICPALGCGRRVAILYGGTIFACRHCYRLAYPSSREHASDRLTRRADRLRERLGWEPGILNGEGVKPKWMRWRTLERLSAQHNQLVERSLAIAILRFGPGINDFVMKAMASPDTALANFVSTCLH